MAEQSAENEPSMEEILSSIRRIINEDEDEAPAEGAEAEPAAEAAAEPAVEEELGQDAVDDMFGPSDDGDVEAEAEDVLELTDLADEQPAEVVPVDDDLMVVDREEDVVEAEAEPEIDFSALETEVGDGIMSEPAASAAMGSFHVLADQIRISEQEGRTLEGVIRAIMRPMLKEWLDTNLPRIVDEKVQAEIDRVSRRNR
jgi:cell pole-organizing protein PopZ